jgi:hypothetical protein
MKRVERIQAILQETADTLAMVARIILKSKKIPQHHESQQKPLMILGNGPSLKQTLVEYADKFGDYDLMGVNFAANTPEFQRLKPRRYVLADPHFFVGIESDSNVRKLWENIQSATWQITLHLPASQRRHPILAQLQRNNNIQIEYFNMNATGGFRALRHWAIKKRLAMPRPRNVLIPAIMTGIGCGYKVIFIAGADHTWTRTLSVDSRNRVVSIQPHYYSDTEEEKTRVTSVYENVKLHQVLESMAIAFKAYWEIRDFADYNGINIINVTPESFIDAFERK